MWYNTSWYKKIDWLVCDIFKNSQSKTKFVDKICLHTLPFTFPDYFPSIWYLPSIYPLPCAVPWTFSTVFLLLTGDLLPIKSLQNRGTTELWSQLALPEKGDKVNKYTVRQFPEITGLWWSDYVYCVGTFPS